MSLDYETAQMISEAMKFTELLHKAKPEAKKIAEAALRGHYALLIPDDPRVDSWEVWTDREVK
jgi:hypothetical protein